MITINDVKVYRKTKGKTIIQQWETYWFVVNDKISSGVEKQDGIFKFFSKHCKTLNEAKQHIADTLNSGKSLSFI